MRYFLILAILIIVACSQQDVDPCTQAPIGKSETELTKELGQPIQASDIENNKKALMFKGENIPSMMVVELTKNSKDIFTVTYCNVM